MPLQNQYGGSGGVMFNPNETEEEKRKRYEAEFLRSSVSDAQVSSQQREYDQLSDVGKGPKGRTVGSRNTFVAASPFEHIAHVVAAGIKGKKAKKAKGALEESLGKKAASRASEKADKRVRTEKLDTIKAEQAKQLGDHYTNSDENAKSRIANDVLKMKETEANNIRKHEEKMKKLDQSATDFRPTTSGERKQMSSMRFGIDAVASAGTTFKDSYARPAGAPVISQWAVDQATTMGLEPDDVAGMLNKMGMGGDNEAEDTNFQDAARWMAGWRQGYTLWQRNELFGATLTPSEQKAWNSAGEINLNMDADEIRKRVSQAEAIMRKRADASAYTSATAGQNPAMFAGMTSPEYDVSAYGQDMAAPAAGAAPTEAAQPNQPQRIISYKDVDKY